MLMFIGFAVLIGLIILGVPLWVAFSAGGMILLLFASEVPAVSIPITVFGSVNTFTFMAIPFFLLGGNIMAYCGPSVYIFNAINAWFGRIRGGLALVSVLMSMVYAAITGSSTATLAGVYEITVPYMFKTGYTKQFCAGLLAVVSTIGQLIPPSIYMIIYGVIAEQNVATLFISGIVPGFITGFALAAVAVFLSPKTSAAANFDPQEYSWKNRWKTLYISLPALIMPLIILGGIYTGTFTPTEAGAFAAFYGIIISIAYRKATFHNSWQAFKQATMYTGVVFMIVASSMLFATHLTYEQIPHAITEIITNSGLQGNALLFACLLLFFILGMFLDPLPILLVTVPILLPALKASGVNLIHFNILVVISMQIAQITPPFGMSLFVTSGLTKVPINEVIKSSLPFLGVLIVMLMLFTFFPEITLWLPNLMNMR